MKPLVLIAGLASHASEFDLLANSLTERGLACFKTNNLLLGSTPRGQRAPTVSIAEQAEHQWKAVRAWTREPVSLFGMSMGGMIAATMAATDPQRVDKLILAVSPVNSSLNPSVTTKILTEWTGGQTRNSLKDSFRILFGKSCLESHPEIFEKYAEYRLAGASGQSPSEFLAQLDSVMKFPGQATYAQIQGLASRTLILAAEEDKLIGSGHTNEAHQWLPGSTLRTLPKTGHMIHLEALPLLVSEIHSFLNA